MSASPPPPERKRPRESDDEEGDGSVSAKRVAKLEGDDANAPNRAAQNEQEEIVFVPEDALERVVGKDGASLRVLCNLSGATDIIVAEQGDPETHQRAIRIVGSADQVRYCKAIIRQRVAPEGSPIPQPHVLPGAVEQQAPIIQQQPTMQLQHVVSGADTIVFVPDDSVGRLIGKQGSTIRHIQDLCGAHVEVAKEPKPGATTRELTLSGTPEQITYCRQLIELKLEGQQLPAPPSYKTEMVVHVPNDMVGRIIGKAGATIKELQDASGAHIDIAKECEPGSSQREVILRGDKRQIALCSRLLQAKVSGQDVPMFRAPQAAAPMMMRTPIMVQAPNMMPQMLMMPQVPGMMAPVYQQPVSVPQAMPQAFVPQPPAAAVRQPYEQQHQVHQAQPQHHQMPVQAPQPQYGGHQFAGHPQPQIPPQPAHQQPLASQQQQYQQYQQQQYAAQHAAPAAPAASTAAAADPYAAYYAQLAMSAAQQPNAQSYQQAYAAQQQAYYGGAQASAYGGAYNYGQTVEADGRHVQVMTVPNDVVGRLIGKAGSSIKQIQDQSGAHVDVPRDVGSATRDLTIKGDPMQIQTCITLINQKISSR